MNFLSAVFYALNDTDLSISGFSTRSSKLTHAASQDLAPCARNGAQYVQFESGHYTHRFVSTYGTRGYVYKVRATIITLYSTHNGDAKTIKSRGRHDHDTDAHQKHSWKITRARNL